MDVAAEGHAQAARKSLEDALNLVVLVLPVGSDVEVDACSIGEALEEMEEHLGGHVADVFAAELCLPLEPGTAAEVKGDGAEAVVHRKRESVTFDTTLVAEGEGKTFAESECSVLNGVVLIDVEVATDVDAEVDASVAGYLLEHVVEESETGRD